MDYYDYGYGYGFENFFAMFFLVFFGIALLVFVVSILLYVLQSIGVMTIARNRGMQNPWIIWIPIVGAYTIGAIADDIQAREGSRTFYRWFLLGGRLVTFLVSIFSSAAAFGNVMNMIASFDAYGYGGDPYAMLSPFNMFFSVFGSVTSLISLALFVIEIVALNCIYRCYKPESATAYTVLSVIFFWLMPYIYPFALRNRQPNWINPPPYYAPGGYPPPPPDGYNGQNPNPGPYQYPPQQPPQYGQPPQQTYTPQNGAYPPPQPPQPQPSQNQNPYGDDPNRQ